MKKKITALILSLFIILPGIAFAEVNEDLGDAIYGVALNDEQKNQMDELFSISNKEANRDVVDSSDLKKYLGYEGSDYDMISSVYVNRNTGKKGIKVNIATAENITMISEGQYANAAITAGIENADITVASPKKVTGESALVGVYKSEQLRGKDLDTQRTQTAQEELETVSEITQENKDKEGFDENSLDKVVIEVKQKLQAKKEETGESLDAESIRIIIEDSLKDFNMGDILSNNNINILVNYFEKYQNTSAIDSQSVKENLNNLAKDLGDKANKFYEDNKDSIDNLGKKVQQEAKNAKDSGFLDSLVEFFDSIIKAISDFFKNL